MQYRKVKVMEDIIFDRSLFEFKKDEIRAKDHVREIIIRPVTTTLCECGAMFSELRSKGYRRRTVTCLDHHNNFVEIIIERKLFECKYCQSLILETDHDLYKNQKYSQKVIEFLTDKIMFDGYSYSKISNEYGVSKTVLEKALKKNMAEFRDTYIIVTNVVNLYFVPFTHNGKKRCCVGGRIIENGESMNVVFDYLEEYTAESVSYFINNQLKGKESVKVVSVILDDEIINTVKELLPDASIEVNSNIYREILSELEYDKEDKDKFYRESGKARQLSNIIANSPNKEHLRKAIERFFERSEDVESFGTAKEKILDNLEELIAASDNAESDADISEITGHIKKLNKNKSFENLHCSQMKNKEIVHHASVYIQKRGYITDEFVEEYRSSFYIRIS